MLHFVHGDMFDLRADIHVNTVNCVGVMGAGVALAMKSKYPEMFRAYKKACENGEVKPGELHVWRTLTEWIINFPTKRHWREDSRYEDVESGLVALRAYLAGLGHVRVTLPALGCGHGGLDWGRVSKLICNYLDDLDADIFVFEPRDSTAAGERAVKRKHSRVAETPSQSDLLTQACRETTALRNLGIDHARVIGNPGFLDWPLLLFATSMNPGEREERVLHACIEAIARPQITLAFSYHGKSSWSLCETALSRGANVLLFVVEDSDCIEFAKLPMMNKSKISIVSLENRNAASGAASILAKRARAVLVTAPCAVLDMDLTGQYLERPSQVESSLFFVRYSEMDPEAILRMKRLGAKPIGRRPKDGLPNVSSILASVTFRKASRHE